MANEWLHLLCLSIWRGFRVQFENGCIPGRPSRSPAAMVLTRLVTYSAAAPSRITSPLASGEIRCRLPSASI